MPACLPAELFIKFSDKSVQSGGSHFMFYSAMQQAQTPGGAAIKRSLNFNVPEKMGMSCCIMNFEHANIFNSSSKMPGYFKGTLKVLSLEIPFDVVLVHCVFSTFPLPWFSCS